MAFLIKQGILTYGPRSDKRDLMAIKSKVGFLHRKKDQAIVNNYLNLKEIIFTNSKNMSV